MRPNNPGCLVGIEGGVIVSFSNVYDDTERAKAYAALEFPGTYYLAYPRFARDHLSVRYRTAKLSISAAARPPPPGFLKKLGFNAIGIDISSSMIQLAKNADPHWRVSTGGLDGELRRVPSLARF